MTQQTIRLYTTAPYPCSYLPGKQARSQVAAPAELIHAPAYDELIEHGFRRSGSFVYRPRCDHCQACKPVRVDATQFHPDRSQRRCWTRHHQVLSATLSSPYWSPEHYALYLRYQQARHPGGGMDEDDRAQYAGFLLESSVQTQLAEFRDADGRVVMVSLIDMLDQGLSAVYTFYDPDAPGSLGTYAILWQIDLCRRLGLSWLYLGYWIENSRKMAYKIRFQPLQVRRNGTWQDILPTQP
ncbi:arginyltransferase [Corticimicrobacter populi]|uniref:Aspartate/glutamate leucyltransferase n=1 Tax=Corticimicrobacter populi TaxID=2175229 RepID=A0A2V1K831_9BURK|nr:arginyltransferase [Corticimicrobacter populi]PWF25122.1 arginyltransferase [Corticimicrobacter populi]